jgi:non-homologous end joining protein Ku
LIELIEEKVKHDGKKAVSAKIKPKAATNVVDLVAVLQKSLAETKKKSGDSRREATSQRNRRKLKKAA